MLQIALGGEFVRLHRPWLGTVHILLLDCCALIYSVHSLGIDNPRLSVLSRASNQVCSTHFGYLSFSFLLLSNLGRTELQSLQCRCFEFYIASRADNSSILQAAILIAVEILTFPNSPDVDALRKSVSSALLQLESHVAVSVSRGQILRISALCLLADIVFIGSEYLPKVSWCHPFPTAERCIPL